jgi:hypothetical protein
MVKALRIACASLIFTVGASLKTRAATITFTFDATVTDVPADFPALNLPFSLNPGQKFSGEYSFASAQDMHDVFFPSYPNGLGKSGTVTITIGNSVCIAPVNVAILNDGALFSPSDSSFPASIDLSYQSNNNVIPPWDGFIGNKRWNTDLSLRGLEGTFQSPEQILNLDLWNQLNVQRELDLQFAYLAGSNLNYVTVKTQVGDFRGAPEPTTLQLIWLGAFGWISLGRKERHV